MKTISEYEDLKFPGYALSYLINNDASGIEDEDRENCDRWAQQFYDEAKEHNAHVFFATEPDDEGSFTSRPEFGLACDCVRLRVLILA
jgi:hypothetical protein